MTDRRDPYLGFAAHYDLHGWDWYGVHQGPRLFQLLEQRGLDGGRVLDAGCGTGTLALAMADRGYQVVGIDLSEAMLAVARGKDPAGRVNWRRADITGFDLSDIVRDHGPFDLVTCVADTLNHLETLDEWQAAFRRSAAHLKPGGGIFFDVMTSRGLEKLDRFVVADTDGRTLILGIVYEPAARRSTVKATSFAPAGGTGLYEKACETITEWGQPVERILERLSRSGFVEVERLWGREEDPEKEDRLSILARRA